MKTKRKKNSLAWNSSRKDMILGKPTLCPNPQNYTAEDLFLKVNNQNFTNLQNFWYQMNKWMGSEKEEKIVQDCKKWLRNEWKPQRRNNGVTSQLWEGNFWWREEEDDQCRAWFK